MNATKPRTTTRKLAPVYVAVVEIHCPCCDRQDPIPGPDGSFMWERRPDIVTCPDCLNTSRTARSYS